MSAAVAASGMVYARSVSYKKRTPQENFEDAIEKILSWTAVPDPVQAGPVGETYQSTNQCLKNVDNTLHKLFKKHTNVCDLRKSLMDLPPAATRARNLSWPHLVRTDGNVRSSCGEIARAIVHYRQWKDVVGITSEAGKRLLRDLFTSLGKIANVNVSEAFKQFVGKQSDLLRIAGHFVAEKQTSAREWTARQTRKVQKLLKLAGGGRTRTRPSIHTNRTRRRL